MTTQEPVVDEGLVGVADLAASDLLDDDELFREPYVDIDEERFEPAPHRYVHGGFHGTRTRFSIYLPPAELYEGRFFQHITPVPDSEHLAPSESGPASKVGMALASGAYFLETNGGGATNPFDPTVDPTIGAYRANAACAQASRLVAARVYGPHRPFGYAFGGSGGGFRTIGGAENTTGVWDGVVPFVIGSPMAMPNVFTARLHALRVLDGAFDRIVDAVEPGGSGDPWEGLTVEQRAALTEVTRMGFPLPSWYAHASMDLHGFGALFTGLAAMDPDYFEDFWTVAGYLGADAPESLQADRVQLDCHVAELLTPDDLLDAHGSVLAHAGQSHGGVDDAWLGSQSRPLVPVAVRLSQGVGRRVLGAEMLVRTGDAAGARLVLLTVDDDIATFGPADPAVLTSLHPGDSVLLENDRFLATQTYHRHQVPGPGYPVWDQFRLPDGTPVYPQRPFLVGPVITAAASGTVPTGRFGGRMIVLESLWDREAFPWQADWYRSRVLEHLGDDLDDRFRLWFVDHAVHADDESPDSATHTVSYLGVLFQALRDLSAWVEQDVAPSPSTAFRVTDGQVQVPRSASERRGIQPVADLTVDAGVRADVAVGDEVTLRVVAEVPPGAGLLTTVEWDLDDTGTFELVDRVDPAGRVALVRALAVDGRGTRFVTVRVTSQRVGDEHDEFTRVQNLARVRVVAR